MAILEILQPTDIINNRKVSNIVEERINGEVAPESILTRCAELILNKKAVFPGIFRQFIGVGVAPEGGDLNDQVATEPDMGEPKPAPDQETVAKQLLHLLWCRVGANIEVLRRPAQQQVTNTAADQVSLVAVAMQSIEDFKRTFVNLFAGDAVG